MMGLLPIKANRGEQSAGPKERDVGTEAVGWTTGAEMQHATNTTRTIC